MDIGLLIFRYITNSAVDVFSHMYKCIYIVNSESNGPKNMCVHA